MASSKVNLSKNFIPLFCFYFIVVNGCNTNYCPTQENKIGVVLDLFQHENAEEKSLLCNDGTPGGFYAKFNENSDLWIFYQEGGGWCYDESTCKERITDPLAFGLHPELISSKNWPTIKYLRGIFETYSDANLVSVPYFILLHT